VIFRGDKQLSKHRQAGNPAMFYFPITSKLLHNSPTVALSKVE
jgi:hypothetical protein